MTSTEATKVWSFPLSLAVLSYWGRMWSGREISVLPHFPALFWWQLRSSTSTVNQNIPWNRDTLPGLSDWQEIQVENSIFVRLVHRSLFSFLLCWTSQEDGSCWILSPTKGDSTWKHIQVGEKCSSTYFLVIVSNWGFWRSEMSQWRFFFRMLCDLCTCEDKEEKGFGLGCLWLVFISLFPSASVSGEIPQLQTELGFEVSFIRDVTPWLCMGSFTWVKIKCCL